MYIFVRRKIEIVTHKILLISDPKMTANSEMLVKCLDLTKHIVDKIMVCHINIKFGEGKDEFAYNFNNVCAKRMSPSQEKRNFLRKEEHIKKKIIKKECEVAKFGQEVDEEGINDNIENENESVEV